MDTYAVIPLAATIAYIPLLIVSLMHKPWHRQQGAFVLFLIPAILWSLSDFMLRSHLLDINQTVLVKVIVCLAVWMVIQFHYVLKSVHSKPGRIPLAYLPLVAIIALTALDKIPASIHITREEIEIVYGPWMYAVVSIVILIIAWDVYMLARKRRMSTQPVERNQILYLLLVTLTGAVMISSALTKIGTTYALAHVGNLSAALILLYAIASHQLLDLGAAFRRLLMYFWLTITAAICYFFLFWLASATLAFDFDWVVALAGAAATICCIVIIAAISATTRRVIEELFLGQKYDYRQELLQFIISIRNIADLTEFSNRLLSLLCRSVGAETAWLLLPTLDDGTYRSRFHYQQEISDDIVIELMPDSPLVKRLAQGSVPLSQKEINILPEFAALWGQEKRAIESARIELFFPLKNDDKLVGILAMGKKRKNAAYTYEEIELITNTLNSVGPSIDREHMREQTAVKEKSLALVNELMVIMTSSIDIRESFDRFFERLGQFVPADWGAICLADEDELHIIAFKSSLPAPWQPREKITLAGTGTEMAMKQQRAIYEPDLTKASAFYTGEKHLKQGLRSIIYVPLIYGGKSLGSLTIGSRHPDAYKESQIRFLEQLALHIAPPIANSQLYAQAKEKARLDETTGLFNRRHFNERLREELNRHIRYGEIFSLIMLDLDFFKAYNDAHGHLAGDVLLREISYLIKKSIRTSDQAFRYGGDEFTVILPQTNVDSAYHVAERIRQEVAAYAQARSTGVTCSIGIASCPSDGISPADIVSAADTALYHAKYSGRNRIHLTGSLTTTGAARGAENAEARGLSLATIYALTTAVDARDHYTYAHSQRVREYIIILAETLGLPSETVSRLGAAALLHDIGKIGVRDSILTKSGPLTSEEFEEVKAHPRLATAIISNMPSLAPCAPAILFHHERYDGTGYPQGLAGEEIPFEARVLAVVDCFADMTADRPYKPALEWNEAIEEIRRHAGTQFDPNIAKVFIDLVESGAIPKIPKVK